MQKKQKNPAYMSYKLLVCKNAVLDSKLAVQNSERQTKLCIFCEKTSPDNYVDWI